MIGGHWHFFFNLYNGGSTLEVRGGEEEGAVKFKIIGPFAVLSIGFVLKIREGGAAGPRAPPLDPPLFCYVKQIEPNETNQDYIQ